MEFQTLIDVLERSRSLPGKGVTFIEKGDEEVFISYAGLYDSALRVLGFLQDRGLQKGSEVVFQLEDNSTFVACFWACILGGMIPVPLTTGQQEEHRQKVFTVWENLRDPYLLSTGSAADRLRAHAVLAGTSGSFNRMAARMLDAAEAMACSLTGQTADVRPFDLAFIQFSSGSTGKPKGVQITHANLLSNLRAISRAAAYADTDSMISWMPLTHDMGLIGFHINPVFAGINHYLIPVNLFIRYPAIWLGKASEHRVSILCSPNFGYEYALKYCTGKEGRDWDLSAVRIIYNGAEPISARLCREFTDWLRPYRLKTEAMRPVYGLAEATLAVSISQPGETYSIVDVDRRRLNMGDKVQPVAGSDFTIALVNVGTPVDDCALRIVDEKEKEAGEGIVGSVQIKGKNVTSGYYRNEEATALALSGGGWLRTGDVGFFLNGLLYITGREKEILFFHGQNYYSTDLERIAQGIRGIELNKIVITGFFDSVAQREEALAFIFYRGSLPDFLPVASAVKELISRKTGLHLDKVLPVKNIPRTTSGKLQRFVLVEDYKNGKFRDVETRLAQLSSPTEVMTVCEQRLLGIWQAVFGPGKTSLDESFYAAGGNSLKMGMLQMLVLKEFGVELSAESLLENQTLRALGRTIDSLDKKSYRPIHPGEAGTSSAGPVLFPLSAGQRRLYYVCTAEKDSTAYNIPVAVELSGSIDGEKLALCFQQLTARHAVLRTSFHMHEEPMAAIAETTGDILTFAEAGPDQINECLLRAVQPFDLGCAPLIRACLIYTGPGMYILFIDVHHIISDGVSIHALLAELFALYESTPLRPVSLQYSDYTKWEKAGAGPHAAYEAYWRAELKVLPLLEMPADHQRPPVFNKEGEHIDLSVPDTMSQQLHRLAEKQGVSLHVLLLSAYFILLSKYTGYTGVVTGIPVAGRDHPDLQEMQGLFVRNLPICAFPEEDWLFPALLAHISQKVDMALAHQDLPFEEMVRLAGGKQRDMSRNALFDTMFLYQNMGFPAISSPVFKARPFFFDAKSAKYDLSMEVFDHNGQLQLRLEYATAIFRRETMQVLIRQFRTLLGNILCHPEEKLSRLSLDNPEEYAWWVEDFNATVVSYPADMPVHLLFQQQAMAHPAKIALECNGRTLSYAELDRKASQLAAILRQEGIGPNVVTGVLLERSPELIIAILAVLKSGGCYLPLDPGWPGERIGRLLTDSRSRRLITNRGLGERLPAGQTGLIIWEDCVKAGDGRGAPGSGSRADAGSGADAGSTADLAYVIYTSGTTGEPKGVMIPHKALTNYCCWAARQYSKEENIAFPLHTSVAFDLTVTSLFVPLITGNTIVIYPEDDQRFLIDKIVEENKVDVIKLTPAHLRIIREGRYRFSGHSRIKRFIVGGEALPTSLAADIYSQFGGKVEIYNEYGPTEAAVGCMIQLYQPGSGGANVPIGIPSGNMQLYVLDSALQPVAGGIIGEIYISGDGLAAGYLFNETLTRQKFIDNPFKKGQKMYKTGDLARRLPEGVLSFEGRNDQQVKINGYRVEPAEIEDCLRKCAGIKEVLVAAVRDEGGQRMLCAYYIADGSVSSAAGFVAATAGSAAAAYFRNYLSGKVPAYLVPARFVQIEAIPLTAHGKVDYGALPAAAALPQTEVPVRQTEVAVDDTEDPLETIVTQAWETVLGIKGLQPDANFYELGGDSIKAVQISARLFEKGVSIPAKDILRYPAVRQLSRSIVVSGAPGGDPQWAGDRTQGPAGRIQGSVGRTQGPEEGSRGLMPIESWFFSKEFPVNGYYNQSVLLEFREDIDVAALEKTFAALVRHHDGLRSNYDRAAGTIFYNTVHYHNEFRIPEYDIPMAEDTSRLFHSLKGGFDIGSSLLLKAAVIRRGGRHLLFITAHHLIIDGVSWRILLEDLYTLYRPFASGNDIPVLNRTASTREWQRQLPAWVATHGSSRLAAYWKEIENTGFSIPQDMQPQQWLARDIDLVSATVDAETTRFLLCEANETYKTDTGILLTTVLVLTLHQWTGWAQVKVELEGHGRELTDQNLSRTIGWFTSLYPVKIACPDGDIGELIRRVKDLLRNMEWRGADYGPMKYAGLLLRDDPCCIPPVRFNYLGQFGTELSNDLFGMSRLSTGKESHPENRVTARLEIIARITDGQLHLDFHYNRQAHHPATIQRVQTLFLENIIQLSQHIRSQKQPVLSPSDFDVVDLDSGQLSALFS